MDGFVAPLTMLASAWVQPIRSLFNLLTLYSDAFRARNLSREQAFIGRFGAHSPV